MKEVLLLLLAEFRDFLPRLDVLVPREKGFLDVPGMINVAIGMRRSGKTYLMYQKVQQLLARGVAIEQILFINFEDDRLLPMGQKDLGEFVDRFYELYPENHDREAYLFFDEIQNVDGWALVIRRLQDTKNVRIFLTGSSAKLLSKEIASSLRGRSVASEVLPYSFQEYCYAHHIQRFEGPKGQRFLDQFKKHLCQYFSKGGFPAVQNLDPLQRRDILQSYVDSVIFRDIVERYKITNLSLIRYLIKALVKNVSAPFSIHKFYKDIKSQGFKVSKDTIYQYLDYIENAFLVFTVPFFTESARKEKVNPKKIYSIDNGLVSANRIGISLNLGSLFENHLFLDLRRQGKEIYYYLTKDAYEIDFIVKNTDGSYEMIQAVWDHKDQETMKREQRALEAAQQELGIPGRIISAHEYLKEFFI